MKFIIILLSLYLFWKLVLKPMIKYANRPSLDVDLFNPNLSDDEVKLMEVNIKPTDEDIVLYYKMYVKKFEVMQQQTWTTQQPMAFAAWEECAKRETKVTEVGKDMAFVVTGGYQYMIPMTCDAMIGMPPHQIYHRYHDYKSMVKGETCTHTQNG